MADELLHFEDFQAGQEYPCGTHVLTAGEIAEFAREFDPQPQHLDPEASSEILGGYAASGWHLCALAMRMIVDGLFNRSTSMGAPGLDEVQWRKPVRAGDSLSVKVEVLGTRASSSRPDRGFVQLRCSMWRKDERVMFWTCSVMFRRRATEAHPSTGPG